MTSIDWQQVIISILVGAAVAFGTTLAQGILDFLNGLYPEATGGVSASLWYAMKKALWIRSGSHWG